MGMLNFLKRGPRKKRCARCGRGAAHGYSKHAESEAHEIEFLCLSCLETQLRTDYQEYRGRVVVVEPAAGLPCYVFQDREHLRSFSSELDLDIDALLNQIKTCHNCAAPARCMWIGSKGISLETFEDVLRKGPRQTILMWGNSEVSLCGKCASEKIGEALRSGDFEFFEISSPHATQEGIVLPMAY